MNIPFLDLQAQYKTLKDEIRPAIDGVLDSSVYVLGPEVERFEAEFARYCGVPHCVGLNSGTAALALLMQAHNIGVGDEVITVTNSFFATAEAISEVGATPVLIDCEDDTALMDPLLIEAAITPQTKAIIPVHLYGQCANMDAILEIAHRHKLLVFEDACQAHGATYNGKRAGSLADGAAFSFYPGKNLGAYGEGGAVTVHDQGIAERIRMLREHGSRKRYHHDIVGWNERMDALQGAVLNVKLPHLDSWNMRRQEIADSYRSAFAGKIRCIEQRPYGQSANHLFVIRHADRDGLQAHLTAKGIQSLIHYPVPIHLQHAYSKLWKEGDFPIAEQLAKEILSLPLYTELTDEQVQEVIAAVLEF